MGGTANLMLDKTPNGFWNAGMTHTRSEKKLESSLEFKTYTPVRTSQSEKHSSPYMKALGKGMGRSLIHLMLLTEYIIFFSFLPSLKSSRIRT